MKSLNAKTLACAAVAAAAVACGSASTPSDAVSGAGALETSTQAATCTDATQADIWANMVKQPIKPPRFAAGLDLAGGDTWPGLVAQNAQDALCAGTATAGADDDPDNYIDWGTAANGKSGPVEMGFSKTTHKLDYVMFSDGYTGTVDFQSRPGSRFGAHSYSMKVGAPILRDGLPFVIDWTNRQIATELFDALMVTFAPELPSDDVDCVASQHCFFRVLDDNADTGAIFGARDVHFYIHVPATSLSGPTVADYFYMFAEAPRSVPPPPPPPPATATPVTPR